MKLVWWKWNKLKKGEVIDLVIDLPSLLHMVGLDGIYQEPLIYRATEEPPKPVDHSRHLIDEKRLTD